MKTLRTLTLASIAALLYATAPARAQDMDNDAEARDMVFIEQCLQRATAEKVPENRIDDFIDRCLNELYQKQEQAHDGNAPGADDTDGGDQPAGRDRPAAPGDAD